MDKTEALRLLIDFTCEQQSYGNTNNENKLAKIYSNLCEILFKILSEEHHKLILVLDEIVGLRLSNIYESGVAAGVELANDISAVLNEPNAVYRELLKELSYTYDNTFNEANEIIKKYDNA